MLNGTHFAQSLKYHRGHNIYIVWQIRSLATIIGQRVKHTSPRWREQKSQSVNHKGYTEAEEAQYDEPKKKVEGGIRYLTHSPTPTDL